MVSTLVSPVPIELGAKAFVTVSVFATTRLAFAAAVLAPALVLVSAPAAMVLLYVPTTALATLTVTVQFPDAGIVAPASATLAPLLAAVTVPPAQVVAPLALAVFTRLAGYVSVKAAPVTAAAFGFVSVMVSTDVSFVPMDAGANAFATASPVATVSVSLAPAVFAPALAEVSAPMA